MVYQHSQCLERVVQKLATDEDPKNFVLIYSISANVSGQIINYGTVKEVFGVNAYVGINPINNKLQVSFMHTHGHISGIGNGHVHEDGFTGVHTHK